MSRKFVIFVGNLVVKNRFENNQISLLASRQKILKFSYWNLVIGDYLELGIWLLGF